MDKNEQNGVVTIEDLDDQRQKLVEACLEVKVRAHCPYSGFHVGAAVLTKTGHIFKGCNVENASYPLCVCAERVAINNAVTNGHKQFTAIAITCDNPTKFAAPCGACRQCIVEFGEDWAVILVKPNKTIRIISAAQLLPLSFGAGDITDESIHYD